MQSTLLIIIGVYLLMLPVIGLLGRRMSKEETLKDFYLAGGGLSVVPLFFTLYATQYIAAIHCSALPEMLIVKGL